MKLKFEIEKKNLPENKETWIDHVSKLFKEKMPFNNEAIKWKIKSENNDKVTFVNY